MNLDTLALVAFILAGIPFGLFLLNLRVYRPIPKGTNEGGSPSTESVSVLIPARDEASNIAATLDSILANRNCDLEVIVLDDHSADATPAIVAWFARRDSRVRLEEAPPLPAGWCGKQHACYRLAQLARHPLLVFMDADVRLAPDALSKMVRFMSLDGAPGVTGPVALASGVPRQELGTFSERLLIPLIHFVLLGFLPMHWMRRSLSPSMSAGCGQLFVARRDAYEASGGHAMLRDSLHDGLKLPRAFRRARFHTDLFDATPIATCRMYHTDIDTWRGLAKNATEGLAAPGTIVPMTLLLLGGQVLPLFLLAAAAWLSGVGLMFAGAALAMAYLPRLIGVWRFRQPTGSALIHPLGVLALLVIQWQALIKKLLGKPSHWKGRSYGQPAASPKIT